MKRTCAAFLLIVLASAVRGDDIARSRELQQTAAAAREAGDKPAYLAAMRTASALRPQHPTLLMQLAEALAFAGEGAEALRVMSRVADMGFVYALDRPAFASLRAVRGADAIAERFAVNARPHGTARTEFTIDRTGLIAEGLAWDDATERFFVGSVRTGEVLVRSKDGTVRPFAKLQWGAFGMAVDAKRGALWVTTAALPQFEGFESAMKGKSSLVRLDLASGAVKKSYAAAGGGEHHFGDVALGPSGDVFVSDGAENAIYRLRGERLERFAGGFTSVQGIAPTSRYLYVADYSRGLLAIDLESRDAVTLRVPEHVSLLGVDGLYRVPGCGTCLVATQNGTNPNRIIRIRLTSDGLGVAHVRAALVNTPPMLDPTLGVVAGGRFHFNANAQWDAYGDDGKLREGVRLEPAVVLSIELR